MGATLETLEMTPEELQCSRDAVQKMAYGNWLNAGCPACREIDFWLEAEREWIEHNYVPHRMLDGARPQPGSRSSNISAGEKHREPAPKSTRAVHARNASISRGGSTANLSCASTLPKAAWRMSCFPGADRLIEAASTIPPAGLQPLAIFSKRASPTVLCIGR